MAELKYKSIIPNDKPRWLKIIQTWVDKQYNGLIVHILKAILMHLNSLLILQ